MPDLLILFQMGIKNFFTEAEKTAIQQAIADAELNTSGEIRVHIDSRCAGEPKEQAIKLFEKLEMHKTELRNAVLFYLAVDDRKLAILGDQGIDAAVPANFWDEVRDEMLRHFKSQQFAKGLSSGIRMAGEKLKAHFPYQEGDTNELSNEISFEE